MIQLLQNKLVKGAVLTLVSCVMLFGSFAFGVKNAKAAMESPLTEAQLLNLIRIDWFPSSEITSGSFMQAGTITLIDVGEEAENSTQSQVVWENRFVGDVLQIRSIDNYEYNLTFAVKITSTTGTIFLPASNTTQGSQSLGLSPIEGQGDLTRRFSVVAGGLNSTTDHSVGLSVKISHSYQLDPPELLNNDLLDMPSGLVVQTLPEGQGGTPISTSEDLEGDTGFEASFDSAINCGLFDDANLTDCAITILYHVFYAGSVSILTLAGKLFDILTSFAISSKVYRDSTFVISGWSIVRDLSNIFFIFILLIAAFKTMFGQGDVQKTIKNVIVIALLINFSLFMVRVVIDGSNILAHLFYNRISVTGVSNQELPPSIPLNNVGKQKSLSEGITAGLSVQNFLSGPGVSSFLKELGSNRGTITTIVLFALIVNLIAAWTFFQVGFMMLGRIIGLWMAMILAPLAFVMQLVPGAAAYLPNFSFAKWMKDMVQYALLAPVFLFFVYLIMVFINSHFLDGFLVNASNYGSFEMIIIVSLSFIFIIGLLKVAKKTASDMAGEAGNMIAGAATKAFGAVAGVAGGVALGGLAVAGRNTIGAYATSKLESGELQERAAKGGITGWIGKQQLKAADGATKSSFDVRSSGIGKNIQSSLNEALGTKINMNNDVVGAIGYGTDKGAGGLAGIQKRKEEEQKAYAKLLELKGEGAVQQDEKNKAWQDKYQVSLAEAQKKAKKAKVNLNEEDFRKQYEKGEDFALRDNLGRTFKGGSSFKGGEAYVKNAKEVGAENKKAFAEKLNRGGDSFLGAAMESGAVAKSAMGIGGLVGGGSAVSNISAIAGTAGVSGAAAVTGVAAFAGIPKFDEVFTQGRADRAVAREILGAEKKKEKAGVNLADLKKLLTDAKARSGATAGESDSDALKGMAATLKAQQEIQKAQLDLAKKEYLLAFKAHQASPTDPALKAEVDRHEKTFMDISLKHTELGDKISEYKNFSNNEERFTKLLKGEDPEK